MLDNPPALVEPRINAELATCDQLHERWMIGAAAFDLSDAPASWQGALQQASGPWPQLFSLMLSTQQQLLLSNQAPTLPLKLGQPLPPLAQPLVPESHRSLVRRCLGKKYPQAARHLLNLLAARGFSVHPADFLPGGEGPLLYLPWRLWQANLAPDISLDEASWGGIPVPLRQTLLEQLRHGAPEQARQLIDTYARKGNAEQRIIPLQAMACALSDADIPLLQEMAQDRADKIRNLALTLLSRLDLPAADASPMHELATDLAGQLQVKISGLIKKTEQVVPAKLKTKEMRALRTEKFSRVSFSSLATALNLTTVQLAAQWSFDEHAAADNAAFLRLAWDSASDSAFALLAPRCLESLLAGEWVPEDYIHLLGRQNPAEQAMMLLALWQAKSLHFAWDDALAAASAPLTGVSWTQICQTRAWKSFHGELQEALKEQAYITDSALQYQLWALGLLLPAPAAEACMQVCLSLGLLLADPALDTLRLNLELAAANSSTSPSSL